MFKRLCFASLIGIAGMTTAFAGGPDNMGAPVVQSQPLVNLYGSVGYGYTWSGEVSGDAVANRGAAGNENNLNWAMQGSNSHYGSPQFAAGAYYLLPWHGRWYNFSVGLEYNYQTFHYDTGMHQRIGRNPVQVYQAAWDIGMNAGLITLGYGVGFGMHTDVFVQAGLGWSWVNTTGHASTTLNRYQAYSPNTSGPNFAYKIKLGAMFNAERPVSPFIDLYFENYGKQVLSESIDSTTINIAVPNALRAQPAATIYTAGMEVGVKTGILG